jgi:hypothetical protein
MSVIVPFLSTIVCTHYTHTQQLVLYVDTSGISVTSSHSMLSKHFLSLFACHCHTAFANNDAELLTSVEHPLSS